MSQTNLSISLDGLGTAIKECVWPLKGVPLFTAKEISILTGLNERQVYRLINLDIDWQAHHVAILIRESIRVGGSALLDYILPEGIEVASVETETGEIYRDMMEEQRDLSHAADDLEAGDIEKAKADIRKAKKDLSRIEADIKAKGKRR